MSEHISESRKEDTNSHIPVLLRETIEGLALTPGATVIDATLGSGGHFSAILEKLGASGTLLGIDVDKIAVEQVSKRILGASKDLVSCFASKAKRKSHKVYCSCKEKEKCQPRGNGPRVLFAAGNFRNIAEIAREQGLEKVDAIIADLGWRMEQFSNDSKRGGGKGFSFNADEPLEMTFGEAAEYPFTAKDIVNSWREEDIATVLKSYGEERYARKIARAIVARRETKPIETSAELAEMVSEVMPGKYKRGRIHPATKTFQALRIAVNDELDALKECIEVASSLLSPKGRLAIISFHSIEDRIVKQSFAALEKEGNFKRITKKPITPTAGEIQKNLRSRSAKLRIIEKAEETQEEL